MILRQRAAPLWAGAATAAAVHSRDRNGARTSATKRRPSRARLPYLSMHIHETQSDVARCPGERSRDSKAARARRTAEQTRDKLRLGCRRRRRRQVQWLFSVVVRLFARCRRRSLSRCDLGRPNSVGRRAPPIRLIELAGERANFRQ